MSSVEEVLAEVVAIAGELYAGQIGSATDQIAQVAADLGAAWAGTNDSDTGKVLSLLAQAGRDAAGCVAAANQAGHQLSGYAGTL